VSTPWPDEDWLPRHAHSVVVNGTGLDGADVPFDGDSDCWGGEPAGYTDQHHSPDYGPRYDGEYDQGYDGGYGQERDQEHQRTPRPARRERGSREVVTGQEPDAPEWEPSLALRGISGHLTRAVSGVMAWYHVAPRSWSMRPDHECEALMEATGLALTRLAGRWLHWRVLWAPFPSVDWARGHDQWATPLPDQPGAMGWSDWLVSQQRAALAQRKAFKEVYLGVEVHAGRGRLGKLADSFASRGRLRGLAGRIVAQELAALDTEISEIDQIMAGSALAGAPISAGDMASLLARSAALGLPAPGLPPAAPHGDWELEDLAAIDEQAHWTAQPYAPSVRVEGIVDGHTAAASVVIGSLGRLGELDVPAVDLPWMVVPDGLDVPVQWSARMRILPTDRAERSLRQVADRVDAQARHYENDHGERAPSVLIRQVELAARVRDELDTDHSGLSARCEGWWRVAVPGPTEREALCSFEALRAAFHPRIALERGEAQWKTAREFIPGEPLATRAYRRRMSVRHVAMAMPQATEVIGDTHGPLIFTTRTGRPVAWDPWHSIDALQASGLTPIIGTLGSGKTVLMATVAYQALRSRAAYVTLMDPSGPLTRLASLPELAGSARAVDLLDSPPGTLNPYRLIPTPIRGRYPDGPGGDAEYARDLAAANAQRTTLVISTITGLLPAAIRRTGPVQQLLMAAVGKVAATRAETPGSADTTLPGSSQDSHDLREVLSALRADSAEGGGLADALNPILNDTGPGRLLLGHPEHEQGWDSDTDRLLVISTANLTLPRDGVDEQDWDLSEQLAIPALNLAAWLAYRRVYHLPRGEPKLIGLDELHWLSRSSAGRGLIHQLARDNRKFRARVFLAGQLASDVLRLGGGSSTAADSGLAALCHDVFVGKTNDDAAQADALRLLRVPTGVGYEHHLGQLSGQRTASDGQLADQPREFVWRSGAHCETVRLDMTGPHLAGLRHILQTNAAHAQDAR
jgi:hypothetical protein